MVRTDGSSIFLPESETSSTQLTYPRPVPCTPPPLYTPFIDRTDVCETDLHLERLSSEPRSISHRNPVGLFQWCVVAVDFPCIVIPYPSLLLGPVCLNSP